MRGVALNGPVIGSVVTPSGHGYYMVASDGGIFSFGDAGFFGSTGNLKLNKPVNGLVPTATNRGYWMVASDGGRTAVPWVGDTNVPVVGMVRYGNGRVGGGNHHAPPTSGPYGPATPSSAHQVVGVAVAKGALHRDPRPGLPGPPPAALRRHFPHRPDRFDGGPPGCGRASAPPLGTPRWPTPR